MSSYRKTMSEAYKSIYLTKNDTLKPIKEEVELDEGTSQVLAHGGKGQYKVTSGGGVTTVKFKGKVVSSGDFDQGADGWFMNIKGEKGQKFFDTAQGMADYFAKNKITEDLDEGTWHIAKNLNALKKRIQKPMPKNDINVKLVMKMIGDDDLMDAIYDAKQGTDMVPMIKSAMKRLNIAEEAVSMAQQAAIAISKKERGNKPKKEEVELDELKPPSRHVGKSQKNPDMFAVYDQKEKEVKLFKDKKDAEEYAIKNHEELMGHDKPKNVKEEVECDCDCGKSPCEKCGQDHHGIAEEVELDEKKKSTAQASLKDVMALDKKNAADKKQSKKDKKRDDANRKSNRAAGMEEVGIDEASKEGTIKIIKTKDGKFQIQKMTKGKFVDIGKPYNSAKEAEKFRSGQSNLFGEEVDLDEASARADAMKAMHKGKSVDPADVDTFASDDDVKAASKNIIMQLRKSVSLRGDMEVEFGDKKKVKVSSKIAQAVQNKFNKLRRPADKEKFQMQISKSYKDLLKAIKEETIKESKFGIINKQLKGEK